MERALETDLLAMEDLLNRWIDPSRSATDPIVVESWDCLGPYFPCRRLLRMASGVELSDSMDLATDFRP